MRRLVVRVIRSLHLSWHLPRQYFKLCDVVVA